MPFKKPAAQEPVKTDFTHLLTGLLAETQSSKVLAGAGLENVTASSGLPYLKFLTGQSFELNPTSDAYDPDARNQTFYLAGNHEFQSNLGTKAVVQFIKAQPVLKVSEPDGKDKDNKTKWKEVGVEAAPVIRQRKDKLTLPDGTEFYGRTTIRNGQHVYQQIQDEYRALAHILTVNEAGEAEWVLSRIFFNSYRESSFRNFLANMKVNAQGEALYSRIWTIEATVTASDKAAGGISYDYTFESLNYAPDEFVEGAIEVFADAAKYLEGDIQSTTPALPAGEQTVQVLPGPKNDVRSIATAPPPQLNLVGD